MEESPVEDVGESEFEVEEEILREIENSENYNHPINVEPSNIDEIINSNMFRQYVEDININKTKETKVNIIKEIRTVDLWYIHWKTLNKWIKYWWKIKKQREIIFGSSKTVYVINSQDQHMNKFKLSHKRVEKNNVPDSVYEEIINKCKDNPLDVISENETIKSKVKCIYVNVNRWMEWIRIITITVQPKCK